MSMSLSRISSLNWHSYGPIDVDLYGSTAFLGRNQTGKSTMLDLLQFIIAGGDEQLCRFNAASGGSSGGSGRGRTAKSYILCEVDDQKYLRDEDTISYMSATYMDPENKRHPISIGLVVEVRLSGPKDIVGLFIAEGHVVSKDDFMERDEEGDLVVRAPDEFFMDVERKCLEGGGQYQQFDKSMPFIRSYMKVLSNGRNYREHEIRRIFRANRQSISYEKIPSSTKFVRDFMLEERQMRIGSLRDHIQDWRFIKKNIDSVIARLDDLRPVQREGVKFYKALEDLSVFSVIGPLAKYRYHRHAFLKTREDIQRHITALNNISQEIEDYDEHIGKLREEEERIRVLINADGVEDKKNNLYQQIKLVQAEDANSRRVLSDVYQSVAAAVNLIPQHPDLTGYGDLIAIIQKIKSATHGMIVPEWPQNPTEMQDLLVELAQSAAKVSEGLKAAYQQCAGDVHTITRQVEDLRSDLFSARAGQVSVNKSVQSYLDALNDKDIPYRLLFEQTEVLDPEWQVSAEAILGWDREAVFVSDEDYRLALKILRHDHRRGFKMVKLISIRKLDLNNLTPRPGTLATVLSSDDPYIMAYIIRSLGGIHMAKMQDEMSNYTRAVTQTVVDGDIVVTFDDGKSNSNRYVDTLKLGKGAAASNAKRLEKTLSGLEAQEADFISTLSDLDVARKHIDHLMPGVAPWEGVDLYKTQSEIIEADEKIRGLEAQITSIDFTIDPKLQNELEDAIALKDEAKSERKVLEDKAKKIEWEAEKAEEALSLGPNAPGSLAALRITRAGMFEAVGRYMDDFSTAIADINIRYAMLIPEAERGKPRHNTIAEKASGKAIQAKQDYEVLSVDIHNAVTNYLYHYKISESFDRESNVSKILEYVDQQIEDLEQNVLVQYQEEAKEAEIKVSQFMRNNFLNELRDAIDRAKESIGDLNTNLKTRPFLNENYYHYTMEYNQSYRPIIDLMNYVRENIDLDLPLFGAVQDGHPYAEALRIVEEILLDPDVDFSLYEDYRNYLEFKIEVVDRVTGRKSDITRASSKKSGGENQTPFYVSVGAALVSAYYGSSAERFDTFGVALFDEAFSKMDGVVQRQVLRFYDDIGLQAIIGAPEDKRASIMEVMDGFVSIQKRGDDSYANCMAVSDRAREAFAIANPSNIPEEELRTMMGDREAVPVQ
ncbi:SbcC/MukB-like Walker B domain-containing protein [Magnetovibrio sp. PR-2]|uniref:SbcC/MukB-like Walker B domain-containing protein n=1 Tax=Magnetovibrio sp. PR-2 TaxID=3120356 RepID=UPI002FCE37E4